LLPLSTKFAPVGKPVAVRVRIPPSRSSAVTVRLRAWFSAIEVSACGVQVGARLVFVTVIVTFSGVTSVPSSALKVIGYEPD